MQDDESTPTGIWEMDVALGGTHVGDLWTHAAYTGHAGTLTLFNRRALLAMHSAHPKFREVHPPLDLAKIRDGLLTPEEESFLRDVVGPDLADDDGSNGYGNIHVEVVAAPEIGLLDALDDDDEGHVTMADIARRAERIHDNDPFSTLYIDHAGLVSGPSVFRDAKQLAVKFKGVGMSVVVRQTMSREDFRVASRVRSRTGFDTVYTGSDLGHDCEAHSDIVTASWMDQELQDAGQLLFQGLKTRRAACFAPFKVNVDWAARRIPFGEPDR